MLTSTSDLGANTHLNSPLLNRAFGTHRMYSRNLHVTIRGHHVEFICRSYLEPSVFPANGWIRARMPIPRSLLRCVAFWAAILVLTLGFQACMMPGGPHMSRGRVEPRPAVTPAPTATPGVGAAVSFRQDVLPVLRQRCAGCHGGQAGLYLDNYDSVTATTLDRGIIVPGNPGESILVKRVRGEVQPRMPLGGQPLSDQQIEYIILWIQEEVPNN